MQRITLLGSSISARRTLWLVLVAFALAFTVIVGEARAADEGLTDLSIEQLMNEPVTLVSKKETSLFRSPAAISVVTHEDIRRLGVASIPEALRLVTGMDVGRLNSHTYAISARGFEGQFSDKLLVMIDGRTIYEPTFAGVHWPSQDVVMEDLDRIEVIRGPGATLWGANAVNGVVNIITKSAKDTQGALVSASAGTGDQVSASLRFGGRAKNDLYYRAYVKYFSRDGLETSSGGDAPDSTHAVRGGFRMDWAPSDADQFTAQGDLSSGTTEENVVQALLVPPYSESINVMNRNTGGNLLGRWTRTYSDTSQLTIQSYYARAQLGQGGSRDRTGTFDVEMQHRFALGSRNDVVWGVGYRSIADHWNSESSTQIVPAQRTKSLSTAFVQDDVNLVADRLWLMLGSKFSYDNQVGLEVQPGVRLLWTPVEDQTVWASIARAVRTPDRFERGGRSDVSAFPTGPGGPTALVAFIGNRNLKVEELIAYELGYRIEASQRLSIDIAVFYNVYDNLVGFEAGTPVFEINPSPPHLLFPQNADNISGGHSYGGEVEMQWGVTDHWRLAAGYSWLHMRFLDGSSEFDSPEQQAHLRSYLALPRNLELTGAISFVDRLRTQGIASYVRLDLGLTAHPRKSLEVGVWGQNLLDVRHAEFASVTTTLVTEVPRALVAKFTWSF
jgi:iron complex outermembrane receptor protein